MIEYFKAEGLNSTLLGKFADDPLVANARSEDKSYFQSGKAFERLFQDKATGSKLFDEKFFVCEDIKIPDNFIDIFKSKAPLWEHFSFTQKGELNKIKANLHATLEVCIEDIFKRSDDAPRRYPIPQSDYDQMMICVDRMMEMDIELFVDKSYKVKNIINENTLWQYPIYWTSGGIKKKALYDIIVFIEHNGAGWVVPLDLKYMANLSAMSMFFRNTRHKYVIQAMHYSEGLNFVEELEEFNKYPQMPFIVATKTAPYYVQPFMMEEDSIEYAYSDYVKLCYDCEKWIEAGRPATGIKQTKRVKIWSN